MLKSGMGGADLLSPWPRVGGKKEGGSFDRLKMQNNVLMARGRRLRRIGAH